MSLHSESPTSSYAPLIPEQRWFPADDALRSTAYEKLLLGTSRTSRALLRHWFESEHLIENADGSLPQFRYCFAQREAVETVIWLFEVRRAREKYDLLRFGFRTRQSGALELKTATHAYDKPGRYVIAVKVIDIFGNDMMTLMPVTVE
jgi:hypothetical protein